MTRQRIVGGLLALAGGALLAFVIFQSLDRAMNDASIYTTGMPGSLLLCLVAIILLAFGLHRLFAPAGPAKRHGGGAPAAQAPGDSPDGPH
jgi:peptidoglycan/LPS O-acetylase OafA/YrhL